MLAESSARPRPGNAATPWHNIVWARVQRRVRKLQARIAKAVKEGRWRVVRRLQRLLTRSFSAKALAVLRVTENKAGFIEKQTLFPTSSGVPQGGIISPTISNMVLDGMERLLREHFPRTSSKKTKHQVHLVRYADDFIVTADSREVLEHEVRPLLEDFLQERGLELGELPSSRGEQTRLRRDGPLDLGAFVALVPSPSSEEERPLDRRPVLRPRGDARLDLSGESAGREG